jgi:hypothetical protein
MGRGIRFAWASLAAVALAVSLAGTSTTQGGSFSLHVRTDGSDQECTGFADAPKSSAPDCAKLTLGAAIEIAPAGARITIGGGVYSVPPVNIPHNLTIAGQPGARPHLAAQSHAVWIGCADGARCVFSNLELDGKNLEIPAGIKVLGSAAIDNVVFRDFRPGSDYATVAVQAFGPTEITGSVFDNAYVGFMTVNGSLSSVSNSEFRDSRMGMQVLSPNAFVVNNVFRSLDHGVVIRPHQPDPAPAHAVLLSNVFEDTYSAIFVPGEPANRGSVEAHFNRFNGAAYLSSNPANPNDLRNNWWGCDERVERPYCIRVFGDPAPGVFTPWLVMSMKAPTATKSAAPVVVDFNHNSAGQDVSGTGTVLDGLTISFASDKPAVGSVPGSASTVGGVASVAFTPGTTDGAATITAVADQGQAGRRITVDRKAPGTAIKRPADGSKPERIREISGTALDPRPGTGIGTVFVAVMRKVGGKCQFWGGMSWVARPCNKPSWLFAGGKARWIVRLPDDAADAPRRYWITSRATDGLGSTKRSKFTRGVDLVVVDVR